MNSPVTRETLQRHRRSVRLTVIGAALLATVVLTGLIFKLSAVSFDELMQRHFREVAQSTSDEVRALLEPAGPILQECAALASQGGLPVDDPATLGERLATRLRSQPNLAWLTYSDDATGRFTGARRTPDGGLVINRSHPAERGGLPREWQVGNDGSRTELNTAGLKAYDPREKVWYQQAIRTQGIYWTRPFTFHEGVRGITAALRHADERPGRVRGVFTADFLLKDLVRHLENISGKRGGYVYLLERDGTEIVSLKGQDHQAAGDSLRAALQAIEGGVAALPVGAQIFRDIHAGSERQYAAYTAFKVSEQTDWLLVLVVPWGELTGASASSLRWTAVAWWSAFAITLGLTLYGVYSLRRQRSQLELSGGTTAFFENLSEPPPGGGLLDGLELPLSLPSAEMPAELFAQAQDLLADKMLATAPRVKIEERIFPCLAGIPLLARVGQGAMGAVYRGWHPRLKTEVAVKVLSYVLAEQEPEWVQRFYREAQVAAVAKSPHLVGVLDVNEERGLYYLVMEYVRGRNAGEHARQLAASGVRGMDEHDALDLIIAAARGLSEAHAQGIVHRDIKPDNILIPFLSDSDGLWFAQAKLADLGLARQEQQHLSLTDAKFTMGTVGYMAPEQALNFKAAGKPADVFSLGATLYDLLAGAPPFVGTSPFSAMTKTVETPHRPMGEANPRVSAPTQEVIDCCLDKDPEHRYRDGAELLEALLECRRRLG